MARRARWIVDLQTRGSKICHELTTRWGQLMLKRRKSRIWPWVLWAVVVFAVGIIWLIAQRSGFGSAAEWVGAVGEFLIAGVIYYELDENRASTFLANVQKETFLQQRRELYDEYVSTAPGASLKTRAEEFGEKLKGDADLRSKCDVQWSNIDRLQFALRWSLFHRNLAARWFPQTLISLWVMTGPYVRYLQAIRLTDAHEYGLNAVTESINTLVKRQKKGETAQNH